MATFPTFESVLIEIASALGVNKGIQTKKKQKFKNTEMSLENMHSTWKSILSDISNALGLNQEVADDLIVNIEHSFQIHKIIELEIFTFKASKQKILWNYLVRIFIPTIARHAVFWQIESKVDTGMPGGRFWYLPVINSDKKIQLPVQHVLEWLIDLIEEPRANVAKKIESDLRIYSNSGTVLRNLHNWQKAKNMPEISSIKNTFPDEVELTFKGSFILKGTEPDFIQALNFINNKGLSAEILQHEIDINLKDLKKILKSECSEHDKIEFTLKLQERYQKPSSQTIRQRLLVARAVQEGYQRLIKFLTPKIDKFNVDFEKNKTLQLIHLYEMVYNKTMEAHVETYIEDYHLRQKAENEYFTQHLPPLLRYDLLLCFSYEKYPTIPLVAPLLNKKFSKKGEEERIDDIFPTSKEGIKLSNKTYRKNLKQDVLFEKKCNELTDILQQNKAPFKTLKNINDFDLVYETFNASYSNPNIKPLILKRLSELALTETHKIKKIILELNEIFTIKKFNNSTENSVKILLDQASTNTEYDFWSPTLLRFNAYHQIGKNNFKEAERLFNQAMDECKNFNFGPLRGELARDAFAIAISNQKLIPNNHEKYFRDIIFWGGLEAPKSSNASLPSIFDVSRELHEYFWNNLYKCYPNYTPLFSNSQNDFKLFLNDIAPHIKAGTAIDKVLKKHKHLKNKQLKHPQSDSIIFLLMKVSYDMFAKFKEHETRINIQQEIMLEAKSIFKKSIHVIRAVIQEWPEIVDLSDFKQQTPLMLAANYKDYKTVEVLLNAKANPNLKDITGRTALHAACASRCSKSANLLIENGIDGAIANFEGSTALHTSVRLGEVNITRILLKHFPELAFIEDFDGKTPLQLAHKIANDISIYHYLQHHLKLENRAIVTHETYKDLLQLF